LLSGQYTDGHWQRYIGAVRSPTGISNIVGTAEAVLALQRYGIPARAVEFRERVTRASVWLQKATPHSTYEHALQLLALSAAGVAKDAVKKVADSLLAQQRSDGGWAGNPNLGSDAHSTGVALHALRETGFLSAADLAHRRGVQYLLSTQYPDDPGTFGAARLDSNRISSADFLSNTINGFRPPQQDGPRKLLPGASKLPRLEYVKRMRRNSGREDDRAWPEAWTADG